MGEDLLNISQPEWDSNLWPPAQKHDHLILTVTDTRALWLNTWRPAKRCSQDAAELKMESARELQEVVE